MTFSAFIRPLVATLFLGSALAQAQTGTQAPPSPPVQAPPYWPAQAVAVPAPLQPPQPVRVFSAASKPTSEPEAPVYAWKPIRLSVALDATTRWMLPSAARTAWGEKAQPGGGVSVLYNALRVGDRGSLAAEVSLHGQNGQRVWTDGTKVQSSDSRVAVGAVYAHDLFVWLSPYVRGTVGAGSMRLTLSQGGIELSDKRRFLEASVGGGLSLRTPSLRMGKTADSFALAAIVRLEGGYLLGNSQKFSVGRKAEGVDDPIPVASVDVGSVPHRAPYFRFSIGLGF